MLPILKKASLPSLAGLLILTTLIISSCATSEVAPASLKDFYEKNLRLSEKNPRQTEAAQNMQSIVVTYSGTRFASLASLRLAELLFNSIASGTTPYNELEKIELFYRSFMIQNPNHILTPYVLNRMMQLAYLKASDNIFYTVKDQKPYRDSLQIFSNFQILFPDSIYFEEAKYFAKHARSKLAEDEERIGDWYYQLQNYGAAAKRYSYILTNFIDYQNKQRVSEKLIAALKNNLQLGLAEQYQKSYEELYQTFEN